MGSWIESLRRLGQALLEVFQAEMAELGRELGTSGKHLLKAIVFFVVVLFFAFWMVMAFYLFFTALFSAILALWIDDPFWAVTAGSGVGLLFLLLVMGVLGLLGYLQIKKFGNPAESVRRRFDDHRTWWHERLLPQEKRVGPPDGTAVGGPDRPTAGEDWS
jgi:hypothetical protein